MLKLRSKLFSWTFCLAACVAFTATAEPNLHAQDEKPKKKKQADTKADAKKYTDKEGGFSIVFPDNAKPKKSSTELDTPAGKSTLNINAVETKEGSAYLVMWNDFPINVEGVAADAVLDGAVGGVSQRGEIVSQKKTKFGPDSIPAREVVLDSNEGNLRLRILIVLRENRLYQVMAVGPEKFADSTAAKNVIKSFEFSKITKDD